MRHRKSGRHLNRNSAHRKAMFKNMAVSLMQNEIIQTTLPKAKELRRVVEPLITVAKKEDSVANRRLAFARLRDKAVTAKLFTELAPRYQSRPGGYVRILKCGFRKGDNAPMAFVELVDRDLNATDAKAEAKVETKAKKAPKIIEASDVVPAEDKAVAEKPAETKKED